MNTLRDLKPLSIEISASIHSTPHNNVHSINHSHIRTSSGEVVYRVMAARDVADANEDVALESLLLTRQCLIRLM
jgi:hypothetical protein